MMSRILLLPLLLPLAVPPADAAPDVRPNIVLIVADDLGYNDLGCYGATKIKTPCMDRLAAEGVRFTDAHSTAAVCNPSRYSILCGTYLWNSKRKSDDYSLYFREGQVTLPSLLKSAGYRTAALGKWHNGFGRGGDPDWNAELKPGPLEIGFDSFFGLPKSHNEPPLVFVEDHFVVGLDPADPIRIDSTKGPHGEMSGGTKARAARPDERIDLILAEKAAAFFARQSPETPFFLYLGFAAPHVPINPDGSFHDTSQAGRYGDFVQQLDHCTGIVLDALEKHGLSSNTFVILTSDNGAVLDGVATAKGHRSNGVLLGQKTDIWEGGHRVPLLARWPGRIPAATERQALLSQVDLMATVAEAAGVALPPGASPDGAGDLAAFTDPARAPVKRTEALFLGTGGRMLRQGDWIYFPKQGSGGMTVQVPPGPPWGQPYSKLGLSNSDVTAEGGVKPDAPPAQLYNLHDDLSQAHNRLNAEPETAKRLADRFKEIFPEKKKTKEQLP